MNDMQTNIEKNVMRRVRLIRLIALVLSTAMLAVLSFAAAMWGIGREVWVARVLENAPADIALLPKFYLDAFTHTHLIVQVLVIFTIISLFFLIRELARVLISAVTPLHTQ